MTERIFNFSAGPAVLPEDVLRIARESILCYGDTGLGVMEMSHRGAPFKAIIENAEKSFKELLGITDSHSVLFLQGGASLQFHMAPLNLAEGKTPAYINTGGWSKKAIQEAERLGSVNVVASGKDSEFSKLPECPLSALGSETPYVHFTSNNTLVGTQFPVEPDAGNIPLVCDASSDILSRPVDIQSYGLLYAGAQKNLGPAGLAVAIIRKDMLERSKESIPPLLSYANHAKAGSLYNTPPTFSIYVVGLVLEWIKEQGGLKGISKKNEAKAKLLYDALDASDFYRGTADKGSRSLMNVTFRLLTEDLEAKFIKEAAAQGLSGLKGHRSVGGIRASIYNAFPLQGIERLVSFMKDFASQNG